MTPNETFIKELEKIEAQITKEISNIISQSKGTTLNRMSIIEDYNIEKRMTELGYQESLLKYVESFDGAVIGSQFINKISLDFVDEVNLIQNNLGEYLLGKQREFHSLLTMEVQNGIMSGKLDKEIIKSLSNVPLSERQLKTVVNTSYQNHSRNITKEAFKDDEEQLFEYVGGLIPTSSDICRELIESGETYTQAEINAGIPSGGGMVFWDGRDPNFNCGHEWLPVSSVATETKI